MGINQRVSLRKFIDDIRRWVEEDRSDEWIAPLNKPFFGAIVFRLRNAIYRRGGGSTLHDPQEYLPTKGCSSQKVQASGSTPKWETTCWQKRWKSTERVELPTPTRMVLVRRGGARSSSR